MLTLADTAKAQRRRKLEKENEERLMAGLLQLQQEKAAEVRVHQPTPQSAPKSHYMFNTPLIPKVWSI